MFEPTQKLSTSKIMSSNCCSKKRVLVSTACTPDPDLQDNGLDIKALPEFVHLMKDGTQMSGMMFNIIVENAV